MLWPRFLLSFGCLIDDERATHGHLKVKIFKGIHQVPCFSSSGIHGCFLHKLVCGKREEERGQHTALFYPCSYGKFGQIVSTDGHKLIWDAIMSKNSPECWAVNAIKGVGEVD